MDPELNTEEMSTLTSSLNATGESAQSAIPPNNPGLGTLGDAGLTQTYDTFLAAGKERTKLITAWCTRTATAVADTSKCSVDHDQEWATNFTYDEHKFQ